jgi:uncharacterized protein (TIGR00730 family)
MLEKLCVFCASSTQIDPVYFNAAKELADVCVDNNIHVLYGGGGVGLMGALADRMLARNGKITGIIPDFMKQLEWAHTEVTEMVVVEDMRERKKRMIDNVDAVVALPGGIGTLEELMEVITLKQLGRFSKPIIIVNTLGFYDSLVRFLFEMIDKKFMREEHCKIWDVIESASQLIKTVNDACNVDLGSFPKIV